MTVRSRIALGIAFLLTVIVVLGALGTVTLSNIQERNDRVYRASFRELATTERALRALTELSAAILSSDSARIARHLDRFERTLAAATEQPAEVDGGDDREQAPTRYVRLNLREDARTMRRLLAAGVPVADLAESTQPVLTDLGDQLHALYAQNEQEVASAIRESAVLADSAQQQMAIIGGVCVLFALGVLVWLPHYVIAPISHLNETITALAAGDFRARVQLDRSDEFGKLARGFNEMAAKLEGFSAQNVAELVETRNRVTTLLDQLTELIFGIDRERRVVFINAPMAAYLGVDAVQALGEYLPDLALQNPRLAELFEPIALGKASAIAAIEAAAEDGTRLYYQERVIPVADEAGEPDGYIVLLSDVTDYEERTHRQTDFLATLSHEMKTPIAAIKMSLNLLEDERLGPLDEDQRELTQTIRDNSARLLRMINEVLQLSQTETTELRLALDAVRLPALIEEVLDAHLPLADAKAVTFGVDFPEAPFPVEADAERIRWVIANLVANAIRYAPDASRIDLALRAVSGGLRLEVCDRGPGVPAAERERIFEKYARAAGDQTEGTGLGLAIGREYVEAHGGRIYVDEEYTEGACFVLELPRRLPADLRAQHAGAVAG